MCSKLSPMRIFLHSQKLLSINSHFTKCAASSKFIRRWLTVTHHTLSVYVKPTKTHTFSERHKFKFEVKWYIIANCSQSGWETHKRFELKGLHAWELSGMIKAGTIVNLISFLQWQQGRKNNCQSNDSIQSSDSEMYGNNKQPKKGNYIENLTKLPVIINRKMSWRKEKNFSMQVIAKATITLSKMIFRVHILVSKASIFLLPVYITVKPKKMIWRRSLSQWLDNLVTILE